MYEVVEMKPTTSGVATVPVVTVVNTSGGIERDQLKNAKIAVLRLINDHKEILFEKTSDMLTKESKEAKWSEIANRAHELGAIPWHRNWDYLKDTTWQNWRKRFVEKREKKEKFDNMGMLSKIIYDEADLLIMEILDSLGKNGPSSFHQPSITTMDNNIVPYSVPVTTTASGNNPLRDISDMLEIEFDIKNDDDDEEDDVVDGPILNQIEINEDEGDESMEDYQNVSVGGFQHRNNGHQSQSSSYRRISVNGQQNHETNLSPSTGEEDSFNYPKIISTSSLSTSAARASNLRRNAIGNVRKRPASSITTTATSRPIVSNGRAPTLIVGNHLERELMDLKCKKIRSELELIQKESYKKDLEILQLERSLGLPASNITRKFYKYSSAPPHGVRNDYPR